MTESDKQNVAVLIVKAFIVGIIVGAAVFLAGTVAGGAGCP